MKHFITKTFTAAMALCAMAPMTALAQDVTTLQSGEQTLPVPFKENYAFKTTSAGSLVIFAKAPNSYNSPQNGYTIYTNPDRSASLESMWSYDWDNEYNDGTGYFVKAELVADQVYYLYWSNDYFNNPEGNKQGETQDFIFTFTPAGSGGEVGGGDTLEDVNVTPGIPFTLKNGQKGFFDAPEQCANYAYFKTQVVAHTTVEMTNINVYEDDNWDTAGVLMEGPTAEGSNTVYLFSNQNEKGYKFYLMQTDLEEVEFTISFPEYAEAGPTEITLGEAFDATEGNWYSFDVAGAPITLVVTTTQELDMTNKLNYMIYNDSNKGATRFPAIAEGTKGNDNVWTYTYLINNSGTYYFNCLVTGNYTFALQEIVNEKEPFQAEAQIVSPLAGVAEFYQVVVAWGSEVFDEEKSLFVGEAKITNPNGVALKLGNPSLTPKSAEGSSQLDALSLPIASGSWDDAKVLGDYTIFIPAGYIVNTDGEPNPETTLVYTLKPEAGEGEVGYFEIDGYYTNIPEDYYLNSIEDLVIYFPYDSLTIYSPETDEDGLDTQADDNYVTVYINNEPYEYAELIGSSLVVPILRTATTENVNVQVRFAEAQIQNEEGLVNPPMTISFTLYAGTEVAQFTPASETIFYADSESKEVNVSWNLAENVFMGFNNAGGDFEMSGITVTDQDGQEVELTWFDNIEENETGNGYVISLSTLEAGTYTVNIPVAALSFLEVQMDDFEMAIMNVALNAKATAVYTISEDDAPSTEEPGGDGDDTTGIYGIDSENGVNTIYNLQGVKVDNNKLNKGIYIINGKKVMVK